MLSLGPLLNEEKIVLASLQIQGGFNAFEIQLQIKL